jgi:ubiquinone/menaquinone biosynthesis C-methylase UbiE
MSDYLKKTFNLEDKNLVEVLDEVPLWSAPFGLKLLELVRLKKNIVALDIGFGAGFPLTELAMRLGDTSKVYGIDPWEAASNRAKKKISIYGISNIELINGVAEEIPLKNKTVDLITSNNGLNNVQDLERSLSECARVMRKGGQFVQSINLQDSLIELYTLLESVMDNLDLGNHKYKIREQIYSKRKPLDEFTGLLEKKGFAIQNITHDSFSYRFADGTSLFNHYFIQLAFMEGWKSIIPVDQQSVVFHQIETFLNLQAERDEKIQLTIPYVVIDADRK